MGNLDSLIMHRCDQWLSSAISTGKFSCNGRSVRRPSINHHHSPARSHNSVDSRQDRPLPVRTQSPTPVKAQTREKCAEFALNDLASPRQQGRRCGVSNGLERLGTACSLFEQAEGTCSSRVACLGTKHGCSEQALRLAQRAPQSCLEGSGCTSAIHLGKSQHSERCASTQAGCSQA